MGCWSGKGKNKKRHSFILAVRVGEWVEWENPSGGVLLFYFKVP